MTTAQQRRNGRPAAPQRQDATISDVLEQARRRRGQTASKGPSAAGVDWSDISGRLAEKVDVLGTMRTLEALNHNESPRETFGDTANGLAALIGALRSEQHPGGDTTQPMLAILDYVQKRDSDALRDEVKQIKEALTQPGGESFLDQLFKAQELGLVKGPDSGGGILETITVLKELGVIGQREESNGHKSVAEQIKETMELMRMMSPPRPESPPSVIQFSDGQLSLHDYFQLERFKDERDDRRQTRDLEDKRFEAGREALGRLFDALGEGAAYLLSEEDPDFGTETRALHSEQESGKRRRLVAGQERRVAPDDQWTTVPCDHCSHPNYIDLKDRPVRFHCASCGELNEMTYSEEAEQEEAPAPDAPRQSRTNQEARRPRRRVATGASAQ